MAPQACTDSISRATSLPHEGQINKEALAALVVEHEEMVCACLSEEDNVRLLCLPLMDVPYNDEIYVRNLQSTVNGLVTVYYKWLIVP